MQQSRKHFCFVPGLYTYYLSSQDGVIKLLGRTWRSHWHPAKRILAISPDTPLIILPFHDTRFVLYAERVHGRIRARVDWWNGRLSNLAQVHHRSSTWLGGLCHSSTFILSSSSVYTHQLQTTVILSANVGFLAIQSIDTDSRSRSFAQILSYISSTLSLSNLFVTQILAREHRHGEQQHADNAVSWFVWH